MVFRRANARGGPGRANLRHYSGSPPKRKLSRMKVAIEPVRGVGIGLPIFVPPLAASFVAVLISWRNAAPLAYAGGSLGVLIGADLLNLNKLQGLGTPVLSIGGAGTFDGIFVTGIMAVLLAGFTGSHPSRERLRRAHNCRRPRPAHYRNGAALRQGGGSQGQDAWRCEKL
jgi:hypothetical protein